MSCPGVYVPGFRWWESYDPGLEAVPAESVEKFHVMFVVPDTGNPVSCGSAPKVGPLDADISRIGAFPGYSKSEMK